MNHSVEAPLSMPRKLAIRLLHEAQIATQPFSGVVTAPADETLPPDTWQPCTESAIPATVGALNPERRAWAIYRFDPALEKAEPNPFQPLPELLQLNAVLTTKGVLQLRAWHLWQESMQEQALQIED